MKTISIAYWKRRRFKNFHILRVFTGRARVGYLEGVGVKIKSRQKFVKILSFEAKVCRDFRPIHFLRLFSIILYSSLTRAFRLDFHTDFFLSSLVSLSPSHPPRGFIARLRPSNFTTFFFFSKFIFQHLDGRTVGIIPLSAEAHQKIILTRPAFWNRGEKIRQSAPTPRRYLWHWKYRLKYTFPPHLVPPPR